ncbi:hypothetical protein L1049_016950 [Liquidambar formosana]|uniref:Uncharacterized protein n=1 Tax=Liquidambar formosana TaxID=63359 RepID=A0AAP0X3G1_LIQFO
MNTNYGKPSNPQRGSASLNNFDFDFGLGSGSSRPRSLNDHKNPQTSSYSSYSSSFSSTQSKPATSSSWQPNKPSWTHQPAPSQAARQPGLPSGPTSMVGDISGKSWASAAPSGLSSGIGIANKNPNLFGDLLGSALGQSKSNSNVPLKSATPVSTPASTKGAYSMGNLADSLPKTGNSVKSGGNWGSSEGLGSYSGGYSIGNNSNNKNSNLGGVSMRSMGSGGGGGGGGMGLNKDPFGSLVDFSSKPAGSLNAASKGNKTDTKDDPFGDFQNASKSSAPASQSNVFPASNTSFMGSSSVSNSKMDDFGIPTTKMDDFGIPTKDYGSQNQPPVQTSGVDPLDMLFASSVSAGAAPAASGGIGNRQFTETDDWGLYSDFGGNDGGGTTTELDGLPPPPAGVTASSAKNKGTDNYKQGQYADAIKWLSWAVILLEKASDNAATVEVLSCRASCYKEVGEYKKAVADCTKVLEHDGANVSVLVQRALLY